MKVAVPLFGQDVAPRFGFADAFLVADLSDGRVERQESVTVAAGGWHQRLGELADLGVKVLLCGGFNRRFEPLAESLEIEVIAGLAGEAAALLATYASGGELPFSYGCPFQRRGRGRGGRGQRFGPGHGSGRGRGRGRGRWRDDRDSW